MAEARVVLTTVGLMEKAEEIANELVQRRLAACVNVIGPIRSTYRWKETVERDQEYLLLIKTTADRASALAATFAELHPYELPEHIELAVESGSVPYLEWLGAQVTRDPNQ